MFEIHFSHSAEKSYANLDANTCRRINLILAQLEEGNFHSPNIRALQGQYKGSYRFRTGDWRMVFQIDHSKQIVYVSAIGNRKDVYRD